MKITNALNYLTENNLLFLIEKANKDYNKYTVEHNGKVLSFFDNKSNDAEGFYIVEKGKDNGYNGYNGNDFKSLTTAVNYLKQ